MKREDFIFLFDYLNIFVGLIMKMIISIIILYVVYSTGYTGNLRWYIIILTLIWGFSPMISFTLKCSKEQATKGKEKE